MRKLSYKHRHFDPSLEVNYLTGKSAANQTSRHESDYESLQSVPNMKQQIMAAAIPKALKLTERSYRPFLLMLVDIRTWLPMSP